MRLTLIVACVDGVEYFSGCEAISRALRNLGYNIVSYDIQKTSDGSNDMNFDKVDGLAHGLCNLIWFSLVL